MADFLLSVGVDVGLSYDQMQKDISDLVTQLNQNPQRVRVGLEIDHSAIERFRTEVANIHNSMGGIGRVTVSPVDTGGLNNAIDGIAHLAQSTQGAISTVQTMRAELNSVNAERIQQAIASINGISAEGASAIAHSLGEANVRAMEVRARLLEATDAEQQLVALQVRGTNEAGHMVNYLMTYNTETGEISRRMVDITARLEDATTAESHRATTVREIIDLYRQMHALMRTNANASNTASYAELANQAQLLQDALALARTESISVDEALTRLGTTGATAINGARDAMSAFRLEMEQTGSSGTVNLTTMYNTVAQMQNLLNNNAGYANLATYTNLQTQVNLLAQAIELASNGGMTLEAALTAVGLNGSTAVHNAREAMSAFRAEMSGATSSTEVLTRDNERYATSMSKVNTLLRQVKENTEKWTAAKTGKSSDQYNVYADQARELENLAQRLSQGTMTLQQFNSEYARIKMTADNAATAIRGAGEATQTWTQRVGKLTEKFGTWFSITRIIMAAYRAVRQMVTAVIDVDTAMTELRKVTNETEQRYTQFLENATQRAKSLGATLADTVTATANFARLGYSIDEAEKLADAAIIYKNVGDGIEDINTASESIIATMQAFGVGAEQAMQIVDKFNEVGNNYAISSKGVGDALLRSAAAMNAANNSLDETIALATAANTIVQDPEKVGTTLKTVSMYLRAAKTEAEDAGESTEGMAGSVSELRKEILALTGHKVDIQLDEDTFKSTYQILQELSKVWGELTDVSQANILEMVGGKRNSNVVAALLDNFSVAEKALKTSAYSAGSALAENEKYLDSINGKIAQFKATFETFSQNLIGSDLVKLIVDIGTGILKVLDGLQRLNLLLPSIITIATIIKGIGLSKQLSITTKTLIANKAATESLIASVAKLNVAQKKRLAEDIKAAVASGALTKEQGAQILTTLGLATADGTLTIANRGLATSFKSLMASIPVWGWIALGISVVIEVVLALTSAVNGSGEEFESLNTEFEQTISEMKTLSDNFANLKSNFDDTVPRFVELASGVNELGKNVSLTDEQYEEFLQLNNKIAEMFPELNLGMDENGNYMLALSYSSDTLKNSLSELLEVQRLFTAEEMAKKMPTVLDDIIKIEKGYRDDIKEIEADMSRIKSGSFIQSTSGNAYSAIADAESVQEYYDYIEYLRDKGIEVTSDVENIIGTTAMTYTATWDAASSQAQNAIAGYEKEVDNLEARIKSKWKQSNASVSAWLQSNFLYNDMGSNMQDIAKAMVSGMDFNDLGLVGDSGEKTAENIQSYITKYIINPLYSASPEIKDAFETAMSELASGDITTAEFSDKIKKAFGDLLAGMDENEIENFKKSFIAGFNAMGIAGSDFDSVVDRIITNWSNSTGTVIDGSDSMSASLSDLADTLTKLNSVYSIIETAQEEMSSGSGLSLSTIKALSDATEDYIDFLYEENGLIKLNIDALKEKSKVEMENNISTIKTEIASLEEKRAELQRNIEQVGEEVGEDAVMRKLRSDLQSQLKKVIEDIGAHQNKLSVYLTLYKDIVSEQESFVNSFTDILSVVQKSTSAFDQLDKIYTDIYDKEDFDWGSILNNQNFIDEFGDLGDAYTEFIKVVSNSPDDINACQEAFNNLATAYLLNTDTIKGVTDETRDAAVAMLEQMGIANAAAIIDQKLARDKERLRLTTGEYADATYEEIAGLYSTCEAGSLTQQVLAELMLTKMSINEEGIQTSSDIDQLIALANAANATTTSLANLSMAKSLFKRAEMIEDFEQSQGGYVDLVSLSAYSALLGDAQSYRDQALSLLNSPIEYNEFDPSKFKVDYTGGASYKSSQESSSKSEESDEETWFEREYAQHQHLMNMDKESVKDYLDWLDSAYKRAYDEGIIDLNDYYKYEEEVYKGRQDLFKDYLDDSEHEISMREKYEGESATILSIYEKLMKDTEEEIEAARARGLDDTDDYIQELQDRWQGYYDSAKDIREEAEESAKDSIDELVDYRIKMIKQDIENEKDALDKKLDYLKEFYDKQKEMLQEQYDEEKYLEEQSEKRKTVTDLKSELAMLENDDSAWAQKRKLELQEQLAEAENDLDTFENDHALDLAFDAIDNAYNEQEAQIEAQMDALEERLNDPEALYNQALTEIKNNTGNLYQEMLEYNRKYGTGNDEDVNDIYESAYLTLLEYRNTHGKDYKGIVLPNSTNYKSDTGSWDSSKVSGTNTNNQKNNGTNNSTSKTGGTKNSSPKTSGTNNSTPSLSKGSTITVKTSATHFSSKSGSVKMASFVPGGNYTVYQTSGNEVLIGRDGVYTGWIKKSDIVGYAKGTRNATAGIHSIDELGSEYLFTSSDGTNYRVLNSGDKVLNANATDFLYEFANGGGEILEKIIKSAFDTSLFNHIQPVDNYNNIDMGDIIVQGNADNRTVSEIRRAQRNNLTEMLKGLNKLNK